MWSGRSSKGEGSDEEGVSPPSGVVSGEGAVPLPRKILACIPSKWCILMHSGARLRQL